MRSCDILSWYLRNARVRSSDIRVYLDAISSILNIKGSNLGPFNTSAPSETCVKVSIYAGSGPRAPAYPDVLFQITIMSEIPT